MRLLVFAHTPPPVHGQSVMVATLVEGLRGDPAIELLHVNPRLSRDSSDVGRWRWGKIFSVFGAIFAAWRVRVRNGPAAFYFVPAPGGQRGTLYRDFAVMLFCRPIFSALVLHWHASGLGEWLATRATIPERWLARILLGRADLALVLAPELARDAEALSARRIAVVPNCAPDPGEPPPRPLRGDLPYAVLYLGLCSRTKGLFDTVEAIALANVGAPAAFQLTVAGGFASAEEEKEFLSRASQLPPGLIRHVGFADEKAKHALFAAADVFCFPTAYPHEGQPLALIEALAHDVPIITTRWRAIPSMLPAELVSYVEPGHPEQIVTALVASRHAPRPNGALRRHYLAHFTPERHLAALKAALRSTRV